MNALYGKTDEEFYEFLQDQGYKNIRKLPDGEFAATIELAFTTAVCCGMDVVTAYKYRWCFSKSDDAIGFINSLTEFDQVPTNLENLKGHRYQDRPLLKLKDEKGFDRW